MKTYLTIIVLLLRANARILIQYRANFYAGIFSTLLWVGLALVSIFILTYQAPSIGGWNRQELFLVQGVYSVILGLLYFSVIDNLKILSKSIMWGQLDNKLILPLDSQFIVSVGAFHYPQLSRVLAGIVLIVYALLELNIRPTLLDILSFIVLTMSSITVVYSIWFILTTLSVWVINLYNLNELFSHFTGLTRYPLEIMRHVNAYLLYVLLPLVVVTTVPSQIILRKPDPFLIVSSIILALLLFSVSRAFWRFALRFYTSASS